jgi:hypothetical protein
MENWRDIPGYEGLYEASDLGSIRSSYGKKQHTLKPKCHPTRGGRCDARVNLYKDGKQSTWLVSRLVGLTWVDGYSKGMTINHINGNPLDNRKINLEWVSLRDNIREGFRTGLYENSQKAIVLHGDSEGLRFASMAEASRFCGRNRAYVSLCWQRKKPAVATDGCLYDIEVVGA